MTAVRFAAWLYLNLIPFGVLGMALAAAGLYYDRIHTPVSRRIFCGLLVALALSTTATTLSAQVVYDYCTDPNIASWLWWAMGCYLR